jgi:tetratricopeptide (TPR) repeat protein
MLEAGLVSLRANGDEKGIASIAPHAGIIASQLGEIHRAEGYYEEAAEADPSDPYHPLAIGTLQRGLGRRAEARAAFARCLDLANARGDTEIAELARATLAEFDRDRGAPS